MTLFTLCSRVMTSPQASCPPASGFRTTTCPRCGESFSCGMGAGATPCFCVAIELDSRRLAELQANYPDCLCGACLRTLAADPDSTA